MLRKLEFNRIIFPVVTLFAASVLSTTSHALPNSCELYRSVWNGIFNSTIPNGQFTSYLANLQDECSQLTTYHQLSDTLTSTYGISIEQITLFDAMRFVERSFYKTSSFNNLPIQYTYQRYKADYQKPIPERSTDIWDDWFEGIKQLQTYREIIQSGGHITVGMLQQIHPGFFKYSLEDGDFAYNPKPGQLKNPYAHDGAWWKLKPEEVASVQANVAKIIAHFRALGLVASSADLPKPKAAFSPLTGYPIGSNGVVNSSSSTDNSSDPIFSYDAVSMRENADGSYSMYTTDSRLIRAHLQLLLDFLNGMLDQARAGQPMIRNGEVMTPGQLAYFVQQYFVVIHPFTEGNGRMSRFLQELVLTSFGMSPGSSGDLMTIDADTPHADYYRIAMQKNGELLQTIQGCVDSYDKLTRKSHWGSDDSDSTDDESYSRHTQLPPQRKSIQDIDSTKLSYDCRLLSAPRQ